MKNFYLFVNLFFFQHLIFSQVDSLLINDRLFQLLESVTNVDEGTESYEFFEELINNPININSANSKTLLSLPFLTPLDAKNIIKVRNKINGFNSFQDLLDIKIIENSKILLMKPFIKFGDLKQQVESKNEREFLSFSFRSRFLSDIQDRKGYLNNSYLGNKLKSYQRFKFKYFDFNGGFLIEKDAGENSFADHLTGYIQYKSNGILENLIVGDFSFQFGQGLAVWSPYAVSKNNSTTNSAIKSSRTFLPSNSSEENKFFRGIASSFSLNKSALDVFYSDNKIGATYNSDSTVSNFYLSGYHRTENEISKKNSLRVKSFGISLRQELFQNLNIYLLHLRTNFNDELNFSKNNSLHGKNFSFSSLSYNFSIDKFYMNGEFSYNNLSVASINNIFIGLSENINFLTSIRSYPSNYFNIYANGFGETRLTQNEVGFYFGTELKSQFGILNFYYDFFKYPSSSFSSILPANGNEILSHYSYSFSPSLIFELQFKTSKKEEMQLNNLNYEFRDIVKNNYRIELKYKISSQLFGKTRFEFIDYSNQISRESGFLTYQDLRYNLSKYLSVQTRIIFFDTESYNSRIYEFENHHSGVLLNPALFGEGFRWYILLNYKPINNLNISVRYVEMFKPQLAYISSGLQEIEGNLESNGSIQLDFYF